MAHASDSLERASAPNPAHAQATAQSPDRHVDLEQQATYLQSFMDGAAVPDGNIAGEASTRATDQTDAEAMRPPDPTGEAHLLGAIAVESLITGMVSLIYEQLLGFCPAPVSGTNQQIGLLDCRNSDARSASAGSANGNCAPIRGRSRVDRLGPATILKRRNLAFATQPERRV